MDYSPSTAVLNNEVSYNINRGITVYYSDLVIVDSNSLIDNGLSSIYAASTVDIFVYNSNSVMVTNNTITP